MDFDSLPQVPDVNLAEYDPLLDRARLHLVLAAKALQNEDTLAAVDECNLAFQKLDRASYLPDIDQDTGYAELTRWVMSLYQRCQPAITAHEIEVPMAALQAILDHPTVADTSVDLSLFTFKEPPPTTIPLPMNEEVQRNIVYFSMRMKGTFAKWIERSGRYFPVMEPILREEGMPDEIIFLTMIESGVNPIARSWAKCVGLWQFSKATGESYGLRGDWYTDDRRNPEKSTRAAARHLRDLYNRYRDWHLALAAYNAGAGRIDRALQRSRIKNPNYWDIQEFLPTETQQYVPRYVAATIIGLNPSSYDFADLQYHKPLEYDVVRIDKAYKVEDLAECVGLTADEFFDYNPFLLQPVTPADVPGLEIRVPKGRAQTFASNIVNVSAVKLAEVEYHKVQRGETIFKLAKRFSVSVDQIKKANNMTHTRRLAPGEMLRIPKLPSLDNLSYATAMDNLAAGPSRTETPDPTRRTQGREKVTFAVERGMTLGGIANRYSVTVADLMLWNSMRAGDPLVPGAEFAVWVRPGSGEKSAEQLAAEEAQARIIAENESKAVSKTRETRPAVRAASAKSGRAELHRVANGETLAGIAAKYNVSIENLKSWNQLRNTKIRPGKVLRIYTDDIARALPAQVTAGPSAQGVTDGDNAVADASPIAGAEGTAQSEERTHTVRKGETLWAIASEHGVTTDQVKIWNKLRGNAVQAGRKLIIMGTSTDNKVAERAAADTRPAVEPAPVAVTKSASESKVPAAPFAGRSGTAKGERPKSYTVKKGDNLWSIARSFDIPVEQLSLWNALKDMQVMAGQELLLAEPAEAKSPHPPEKNAQSSRDAGSGSYTVKKGDNLYAIAQETGVSIERLREWNDLKDDVIKAGQELKLASPSMTSSTRPPKPTKPAAQQSYTVKDGDTLYSISRKLGVTISDLQRWNDVGENLRAGQELNYQAQR